MSTNNENAEQAKAPFPQPAKTMNKGSAAQDESGTPAQAPGKRTLEREDVAAPKNENKDASGAAPATEPQQSRELRRNQH